VFWISAGLQEPKGNMLAALSRFRDASNFTYHNWTDLLIFLYRSVGCSYFSSGFSICIGFVPWLMFACFEKRKQKVHQT
jgi:hypothetical protein